jgi:hypothetical protein
LRSRETYLPESLSPELLQRRPSTLSVVRESWLALAHIPAVAAALLSVKDICEVRVSWRRICG